MSETFSIGIVGRYNPGWVETAFKKPNNEIFVVDNIERHIEDLFEWTPNITIVCTEVKFKYNDDSMINIYDYAPITDTVLRLIQNTDGVIIIKTPLKYQEAERLCGLDDRVVYHPDIILDDNTMVSALNPQFMILGGSQQATQAVGQIYMSLSTYATGNIFYLDPKSAAIAHQAISAFEYVKMGFFNELYDVATNEADVDYERVANVLRSDNNIGPSFTRILNGFGGRGIYNPASDINIKLLSESTTGFTYSDNCVTINHRYQKGEN